MASRPVKPRPHAGPSESALPAPRFAGLPILVVLPLIAAVLVITCGCDPQTQHRVLSLLADGVPPYDEWLQPKPRPPRARRSREVRRENPPPPKVAVRAELPAGSAGFPPTWEALVEAFPKDASGDVDWVRALGDGLIAPRSTIPPAPAEELTVLPLDLERRPDDPMKVIFPHEAHTRWLACDNCHTDLFPMEARAMPMSMEQINKGEGCGVCHATVAFPATSCGRCHPGMAG